MDEHEIFNPFPGLRPFHTDEAHLFFGREGQSVELLRLLRQHRFVAVVGPSGSGKSSLVRAGLLPSLHGGFMRSAGSRWRIALLRPGANPIGNLARALGDPDVLGDEKVEERDRLEYMEITLRRGSLGLAEAATEARLAKGENLLVVVDQFEEIFRFQRVSDATEYGDDAAAFVKLLLEASRADVPVYVLLTMRSDYLGDCAQFRDLPEAINHGQYLIPRMTRDERRSAITGPVAVGGGTIAPRVVSRLLNDVGAEPDQLPILQHALMRAWDQWEREHAESEPLDLRHYKAVGGAHEALSRHAEEAFAELDESGKEVAEKVFRRLTERGPDNRDIRRPTRFAELCAIVNAEPAVVVGVIDVFRRPGRSFLMPPAEVGIEADTLVDISHESLIRGWDRLQEWVAKETDAAKRYRRFAETAALWEAGGAGLLQDPELEHMLRWWEKDRPVSAWGRAYHAGFATAEEYLERSRAERDRLLQRERQLQAAKRRRRRVTVAALAIGLLLTSGLAVVALQNWRIARAAEADALVDRDAARRMEEIALAARDSFAIASEERAAEAFRALRAEEEARLQLARALEAEEQARRRLARAIQAEEAAQLQLARAHSAERRNRRQQVDQLDGLKGVLQNAQQDANPGTLSSLLTQEAWALSYLSMYNDAERSYSNALRLNPRNFGALVNRSDAYLNLGEPERARSDLEVALELNQNSWLAHLNMAVAHMLLRDYEAAETHFRSGIEAAGFHASEAGQAKVSPEIRRATGYGSLSLARHEIAAALRYALASMHAFEPNGSAAFADSLRAADREETWSMNTVLNPLNWLWLNREGRTWEEMEHYGQFAAEGALWERVGWSEETKGRGEFAEQSVRSYCRFRRLHDARGDARYGRVARWVDDRLAANNRAGCSGLDLDPPSIAEDIEDLLLEVRERQVTGELAAVDSLYTLALESASEGERPFLLLDRAENRVSLGRRHRAAGEAEVAWRYAEAAQADAEAALSARPNLARAYYLRGRAKYDLARDFTDPSTVSDIVADLDTALEYQPTLTDARTIRAWSLQRLYPREAAASLRATLEQFPAWPHGWGELALLEMRGGEFEAAREAAQVAIRIAPDSLRFYEIAAAAELGLPGDSLQSRDVALRVAREFRQNAEASQGMGDLLRAERFYLAALREHAEAAVFGAVGLEPALSVMGRRYRCIFHVHGARHDPRRLLVDSNLQLSDPTEGVTWPMTEALVRANAVLRETDKHFDAARSCPPLPLAGEPGVPYADPTGEAERSSVVRHLSDLDVTVGVVDTLPVLGRAHGVTGMLDDGPMAGGHYHYALWAFHGERGEAATFTARSGLFDTYLYLFHGGTGELIASDDDGLEGTNSVIRRRLPDSGPYIVAVASFAENERGQYTLAFGDRLSPPLDFEARPVRLPDLGLEVDVGHSLPELGRSRAVEGLLQRGLLAGGRYHGLWTFHGQEGEAASFALRSTDFDAYLYLFDGRTGERLAFDDDGLGDKDSLIEMRLPFTGPYILAAGSFGVGERGRYTLEHGSDF